MPELPEVETVKRSLEKLIIGLKISDVEVLAPSVVVDHQPESFRAILNGLQVENLQRRGKYLIINLSDQLTLVIHLRMTGRLVYLTPDQPPPKYTHLLFHFDNQSRLAFADMRRFGRINLLPTAELKKLSGLKDLGPEPLTGDFSIDYLHQTLKKRRTKIKPLLLNQTFVAGLGNIYADEALHRAQIHPERLAAELNAEEMARLYQAIVGVLTQGIENRGTSFSDYVDGLGNKGSNQHLLKAYNREGEPCHRCGNLILRKKVGGRSSYYCPQCQQPS
ncbi:bifunctional DNA-formamidopyrimidine glycosylase/DNA-(apurinic or apyrimidinic site) lyase [Peptococcaceae bacterium 1198_IL3148]